MSAYLAKGALALGLSAASVILQAEIANAQASDPQEAQAARTASFAIPAQSMSGALTDFGKQSGLQIVADPAAVAGRASSGVSGTMTAEEALQRLLAGTGIPYRFTSLNSVAVGTTGSGSPMQLDPVNVQGAYVPPQAMIDNLPPAYPGGLVATGGQLGLLGNRSVMDTPFNQTSYTAKKAQDQQAKTVRDVLIDDPSVRAWAAQGSIGIDNLRIRGFDGGSGASVAYGGLFGMTPVYSVMPEMAERIEVLKGPSALLNGMQPTGAIGGYINVVPKRAPAEPLTQVTADYISDAQFGGHVDVARRFGADGQFGARFNGVFRAGQTPVQYNSDQRALAVLGLDYRGESVRLSGDFGFQNQYVGGVLSYLGVNPGVQLPWAPDANINQGQPWAFNHRKDIFGVVRAEVDLTEHVTAYASFGAHDNRFEGLFAALTTATNFSGNAVGGSPSYFSQYRQFWTAEGGLRAQADTGPIGHELALVATTYFNENGQNSVAGTPFATNFYNPTFIARPNLVVPAANKASQQILSGLALADTLTAANKRIQLTLGARLQRVAANNFNSVTGAPTTSYDENALSPSAAVIFKPFEIVSVYGNFIQGLQQGAVIGVPFANAGEVLPPYKSTQYEVGVKTDWGKLTTTLSAFQIAQPTLLTDVASNRQFLGGEQRNRGFELNVFGEPVEGVRLLGGIMLLEAVLTKTQGGLTDGWIAPFAPGMNLNLAGEWDLPWVPGLTVNGRVVYTGSQYIDTTFPRRSLPDWTRFDLGARYAFEPLEAKGKPLVARFNIENLFDQNYWAGGNGATILNLGAPRTFRLSLTADF